MQIHSSVKCKTNVARKRKHMENWVVGETAGKGKRSRLAVVIKTNLMEAQGLETDLESKGRISTRGDKAERKISKTQERE